MLRGIVFGELWGIKEDVWIQLWSGTVGAIVSAGVAALVAVLVLTSSNAHQRKLAAEAARKQEETANRQLDEQYALAAQQLAEQRFEAKRVREQAALAEVISTAESLVIFATQSSEVVRSHTPVVQSAMARWRIELGVSPMEQEVRKWSSFLVITAHDLAFVARRDDMGAEYDSWKALNDAVRQLTTVALAWPAAGDREKVQLREQLSAFRLQGEKAARDATSA